VPHAESAELTFGDWQIDSQARRLSRAGRPVRIGARAFQLLLTLAARRSRVVARGELVAMVWSDRKVDDTALNTQIAALRRLIGPSLITTVPGRGYRFTPDAMDVPRATIAGSAQAPLPTAAAARRGNLPPVEPSALIGREADLAELGALLDDGALVSVVGSGGIGKTRLALAAAAQRHASHADGVWWVDLSTLPPQVGATAVAGAIAAALGLPNAQGVAGLRTALRPLHALVLLDNAEHVAGAVSQVLSDIAPVRTRWLVTSQMPLKTADERLFAVKPLAVPPQGSSLEASRTYGALALLRRRAQAVDPRFELTEADAAAAIDICSRLGGLALAIELAAPRLAWLGAPALARRLAKAPHAVGEGSRTAPQRQHTLHSALVWSHALLRPEEQQALHRLSVCVGGFTLELARAVIADRAAMDETQAVEALAALAEKSWVQAGSGEQPRYLLLDSARHFAQCELQRRTGEERATRSRHAAAMLRVAERSDALRWKAPYGVWASVALPECDNFLAAFDWALANEETDLATRLFGRMYFALREGSRGSDLSDRVQALRPLLPRAMDQSLGWTLLAAASVEYDLSPPSGLELLKQALDVARRSTAEPADACLLPLTLSKLIACHSLLGHTGPATLYMTELRELPQTDWPALLHASMAQCEALYSVDLGDQAAALAAGEKSVHWATSAGWLSTAYMSQANMLDVLLAMGQPERAVALGSELLARLSEPRSRKARAVVLINLADAQLSLGHLADAKVALADAVRLGFTPAITGSPVALAAQLAFREDALERTALLIGHCRAAEAAGRLVQEAQHVASQAQILLAIEVRLGQHECARWLDLGARMTGDEVQALICGDDGTLAIA
jgi:predicted ATPase/DNA-binding winged helix-turn-helix (wHTH) protein